MGTRAGARYCPRGSDCQAGLEHGRGAGQDGQMNKAGKSAGELAREERLAARLRENLHRRKAQARALAGSGGASGSPGEDNAALSKTPPKS